MCNSSTDAEVYYCAMLCYILVWTFLLEDCSYESIVYISISFPLNIPAPFYFRSHLRRNSRSVDLWNWKGMVVLSSFGNDKMLMLLWVCSDFQLRGNRRLEPTLFLSPTDPEPSVPRVLTIAKHGGIFSPRTMLKYMLWLSECFPSRVCLNRRHRWNIFDDESRLLSELRGCNLIYRCVKDYYESIWD